jgi:hypothetical protein
MFWWYITLCAEPVLTPHCNNSSGGNCQDVFSFLGDKPDFQGGHAASACPAPQSIRGGGRGDERALLVGGGERNDSIFQ